MYWFYNICLVAYWILQIPLLIYRLVFEEGFYDRLKQSAGIMPTPTLLQIADHNAIWVHAASVGEVVAASPIVRELKKKYPDEMVVVLCGYRHRPPHGPAHYSGSRRAYILSL